MGAAPDRRIAAYRHCQDSQVECGSKGSNMAATILVVEDEPAIQELIKLNLEQAGYRVLQAYSAEEASTMVRAELPHLVILDWVLPGKAGLDFGRSLRGDQRTGAIPIIMLSARVTEKDKLAGFDMGADDYITKPFSPRELAARIAVLLRNTAPQLSDTAVEAGGLRIDPVRRRVSSGVHTIHLNATEFRLLHFLMTHRNRVYSRAQLLDKIWGDHVYVEERTVDVHIRRLRAALEGSGNHERVETVRGTGYRFRGA
jgi:two-component system phosphate regulon response regulator PhoB